ncbi:MAG: GNAT family N-acetyltransferase [Actinomycetota bacterium]|nr:GNAT family N-acetyltransferase [Actinomycetota bacterium]
MSLEYRSPTADEFATVLRATYTAFGEEPKDEDIERDRKLMALDRVLAAWDSGRPVGVTASYPFELTTPGGQAAPAAGVSWVGVLPSHRRRGVLRDLMRRQFDDVHGRGEPLAILWASESLIYGRFGYGIAAPATAMDAERSAFALRDDAGPRGSARLTTADEAAELFPPLYERGRLERPGLLSRTDDWWRNALLADPEHWREGRGPKFFALLEIDGEAVGYAVYRMASKWDEGTPKGEVRVVDACGTSPSATAEVWRFLFGIDLVARVKSDAVDSALPLFLMVTDPRRLHLSVSDGLWLRLVDLEAALRARSFASNEPVVLEVADGMFPRNAGRWGVGPEPGKSEADPDVAIDIADLASAYLGAFSFERLAAAGRAHELRPGGLARATALFATPLPPHCPDGF